MISSFATGYKNSRPVLERLPILFMLFLTPWFLKAQTLSPDELSHNYRVTNDSLSIVRLIEHSRDLHRHNHNTEKEYNYADKAIDNAIAINDSVLYAKALDNKGLLYRFHEHFTEAIPLHIKAYKLIEDKNIDPVHKMIYANNTGVAARYNQQYDLAVTYYLKALKLAETNNDLRNIAIANNGLGNALNHLPDRKEEALSYFKKGLKVEKKRDNSLGQAMNLLSISDYYINKKDKIKSLKNLDRLYKINKKEKDSFGLAITHQFYGEVYRKLDRQYEKAQHHYNEALTGYKKMGNFENTSEVLNLLAQNYLKKDNPQIALEYFNQSLNIADSLNNKSLIKKNAYGIARLKESQGHDAQALTYFKLGRTYEDSINLKEQNEKIAALRNRYDLEKKESEITFLHKDQDLKQEEIKSQNEQIGKQKVITVFLISGICGTVVFTIVQYRNRKAKRKAEETLQKKEQLLLKTKYEKDLAQAEIMISRMQINPHFIFNCLTGIKLLIQKGDTRNAQKYLTTFSRFTRMVLEMPKEETISLREELRLIRYYLKLEKRRFGKEMKFNIHTCPDGCLTHTRIPPLLLQPFVENALWHGLQPSNKKCKHLDVTIFKKDTKTEINIEDNGIGRKKSRLIKDENLPKKRKSLGTEITKKRIKQFNQNHDEHIKMKIIDKAFGKGTQVLLTLSEDGIT